MKVETANFQVAVQSMKVDSSSSEGASAKIVRTATTTELGSKQSIKTSDGDSYPEFAHKPKQELTFDEKDWINLIERANKAINGANKSFEYSIHERTKQIMIKVIDNDTKEVIREIPPEKVLDLVARMWEMAGVLVDERR